MGVCHAYIRKTKLIDKASGTPAFVCYKDALTSRAALWALQGDGREGRPFACIMTAIIRQESAQADADRWGIFSDSARKIFRFRVTSASDRRSAVCIRLVCSANKKSPQAALSLGEGNYTFCLHLKKPNAKTACIKSASKAAKSSVFTYECTHFCIFLSFWCIFMHLLLHDKGDKSRGKTPFCEVFTQHFGYLE